MNTQFRAYAEDELPHLDFKSTKDEAMMDAIARISAERPQNGRQPTIIVEEVREPLIIDFFDFRQLISLMSESMAEKIGNDDAFTEEAIWALSAVGKTSIEAALLEAATDSKFRIDGYIVVNRYRAERWWVNDSDDQ